MYVSDLAWIALAIQLQHTNHARESLNVESCTRVPSLWTNREPSGLDMLANHLLVFQSLH